MKNEMEYKIKSVMVGHAVGDALGVPVEFLSRKELAKDPVTDMRGYGTYPVPAGSWSDDTGMSLAALDSLASGRIRWEEIMDNFVRWLNDGAYTPTGKAFDVGRTCRLAIERYLKSDQTDATVCGGTDERSNGNGSLMRIHPFVLFATFTLPKGNEEDYWLWMACIKSASSMTHAHGRAIMGCYIYGYCLTFLLHKATRESLVEGIKFAGRDLNYLPEFERYHRIFSPDFEKLTVDEIKSSGYVVDTLEAALWCLLTTDNYRDCVLKAVNLGEDTDTVAAVAGGLAGALYGYDAIPKAWRNTLLRRDYIEELCKCASENWR
jgi:ADP-ribosylglycohydrolase